MACRRFLSFEWFFFALASIWTASLFSTARSACHDSREFWIPRRLRISFTLRYWPALNSWIFSGTLKSPRLTLHASEMLLFPHENISEFELHPGIVESLNNLARIIIKKLLYHPRKINDNVHLSIFQRLRQSKINFAWGAVRPGMEKHHCICVDSSRSKLEASIKNRDIIPMASVW